MSLLDITRLKERVDRRCESAKDGFWLDQARKTVSELTALVADIEVMKQKIEFRIEAGERKLAAGSPIECLPVTPKLKEKIISSGYRIIEQLEDEIESGDLSILFLHAPSYVARVKIAIQQYRADNPTPA